MKGLMARAVCIALICHSAAAAEPAAAEPKWLQDANGCKFLSPAPARSLGAISWTGQCVEGFVSGPGEVRIAQWMSFRGEFAQGRLVKGVMEYVGRESYESEAFLDNRLNGNTVVRTLDGTTIQAQYDHGALKSEHAEILWPSGARYRGPLDPGSRLSQGKGTLDYPDGSVYEGEFKQGRLTGTGVMKYASGEIRSGTFIDGALNGHGSIVYADRSRYEGELRMGEPDGYGRIELADGDSYEGTFMAGRSHGKGKATYADGGVYEGDWVAGDPHGSGTRTFANGNRYVGQFVSGKKNGQGLFTQASGETYEGEWRGDQLNGKCRIVINQSIYQGECRDSKASGTGHLEDKSKDLVYEGEFDQDQFQGKGSLHIGDLAYDGMFKAGAMEGPGTLSVGKLTMRGDFKSGVLAHGTITGADGRTFEVDIEKNEIFEVSEDGTKHPIDQLPPDITI